MRFTIYLFCFTAFFCGSYLELIAQYENVNKYIPDELRNLKIKSQLFSDVIIYKYDDSPEYDVSNSYLEMTYTATGDSIMVEKGVVEIDRGLRIIEVESRNYQDSNYVMADNHIASTETKSFRKWSVKGGWVIHFNPWNLYPLMMNFIIGDYKKDSVYRQFSLYMFPDSSSMKKPVSKVKLPNDSVLNSYPFELQLTDSSQWQVYRVYDTKKKFDEQGSEYEETTEFKDEEIVSIRRFKSVSGKNFKRSSTLLVDPDNSSNTMLERIYFRKDGKRKSRIINAHFAFNTWYIEEIISYKNQRGQIIRSEQVSYGAKNVYRVKNEWKPGKPVYKKTKYTTSYQYDSLGRLIKAQYTDGYLKDSNRFDIYTYGENVYVSPENLIYY